MKPIPPALTTAATISDRPRWCMPPSRIGWRMPNSSVMRVRKACHHQLTWRACPAQCGSRSSRLSTLPAADSGSASRNSMLLAGTCSRR